MQETWTKATVGRIIRLDVKLTRAILKHTLHECDRTAERMHAGERTEDASTCKSLISRIARDVDAREFIAHGDCEIRECLVIAQ